MPAYICVTCGVQFAASEAPPPSLPDLRGRAAVRRLERPAVDDAPEMVAKGTGTCSRDEDAGLHRISDRAEFGIGQQALLVQTPAGNVLWDCISLVDDETVAAVRARGGIPAIAISHPHFYADWWSGAGRSATRRSTSTPPTASG